MPKGPWSSYIFKRQTKRWSRWIKYQVLHHSGFISSILLLKVPEQLIIYSHKLRIFLGYLNFSVETMTGHFAIKIVVEKTLVTGTVVKCAEVFALRKNMLVIYICQLVGIVKVL